MKTSKIAGIVKQTDVGVPSYSVIAPTSYVDLSTGLLYFNPSGDTWYNTEQYVIDNFVFKSIVEIDFTINDSKMLLPQEDYTAFVVTNIVVVTTDISGYSSNGTVSFNQGFNNHAGGTNKFSMGNCDTLLEASYLLDVSYPGRIAIDLHNSAWYVYSGTSSGDRTKHKASVIATGTKIKFVPNT